jgi:predicted N-acyltransferase
MPLYLKSHSQGEYVFDHSWAHAYERAGGRYYPKLQCAAPFTPATGPRLLTRADTDRERAEMHLISGATTLCDQIGASSLHVTFLTEGEWTRVGALGLLQRQDQQYHWFNAGYATFDDYLAQLSSGRRKTDPPGAARRAGRAGDPRPDRERSARGALGTPSSASTRTPRAQMGQPLSEPPLLLADRRADAGAHPPADARRGGRWDRGGAELHRRRLSLRAQLGRRRGRPVLHFELCYYSAIDYAIAHGWPAWRPARRVSTRSPGATCPPPVYSAHYIADPMLRDPVARYLKEERRAVEGEMAWLAAEYSPFKEMTP